MFIASHLRVQILFSVKCLLEQFGVFSSVFVDDVGVDVGHHGDLGVAGVALYGFDVTAVQFEFIGDAGVAEAVEDDFGEVMVFDQLVGFLADGGLADRHSGGGGQDEVVVVVLVSEEVYDLFLVFLCWMSISATVFGRNTLRLLLSVFVLLRTRTVLQSLLSGGKT